MRDNPDGVARFLSEIFADNGESPLNSQHNRDLDNVLQEELHKSMEEGVFAPASFKVSAL